MYSIEPLLPEDLFSLDLVNLDSTTDNYSFTYYLHYHLNHPKQMYAIKTKELPSGYFVHVNRIVGYVIGKIELQEPKKIDRSVYSNKSMHISAISVAPSYRLQGLAGQLCGILEKQLPTALFVDLYVRVSNLKAIRFYTKRGYVKFRRIFGYYTTPTEDAWDMRKFITQRPYEGRDVSQVHH